MNKKGAQVDLNRNLHIYKNLLQQFPFDIINLQAITTIGTTTVIIRNIVSPTTWTFLFHHNGLAFGLDSIRITRSAKLPVMLFTFRHDMLIILKKRFASTSLPQKSSSYQTYFPRLLALYYQHCKKAALE